MPSRDETDLKGKECPLCGNVVPGGAEGMNRHFEADCPWRHTSKAPVGKNPRRRGDDRDGTGPAS
jgi:hypothetical protein